MTRPTRIELLEKFFPEIKEKSSTGEKEASIRLNTLACETILADLITRYDNALSKMGRGVLCLFLNKGDHSAAYVPAEDWQHDLELAKSGNHVEMEDFISSTLQAIEDVNPEKAALVMLIDKTAAQLFPIGRDYPANPIKAMLEEFSA